MFIRDENAQLTLLVDRAQGGTGVLAPGQMEVMLHRTSIKDDARGVDEPLYEVDPTTGKGLFVRGTTYIVLAPPEQSAAIWRPLAHSVYMAPQLFFARGGAAAQSDDENDDNNFFSAVSVESFITDPLPQDYQLVSLERLRSQTLMRISYQCKDDKNDSSHDGGFKFLTNILIINIFIFCLEFLKI